MICFQEIPDEISLSFSISNCPHTCEGCHSPYLRTDCGRDVFAILPQLLRKFENKISCVLFMGGDDDKQSLELLEALCYCRGKGLKTALYSGSNVFPSPALSAHLDYIKVGSYVAALGPLNCTTTNQRLYKKENGEWKDITYRFWTSEMP